jgi:O-antigen/teichoic acid export membrane protein
MQINRLLVGTREIALYGSANLVRPAIGLLTLPLYAWLFTPEDFGIIGIYTAMLGLLVIVLPLNGQVYVLWNRVRLGPQRSARAVGSTIEIASVLGVIAAVVGVVYWVIADPDLAPAWIAVLAAATAWATAWILLDTHVHQADEQAGSYFLINLGWAIAGPVGTLLLVGLVAQDWTARIGGIAIATGVTAAWSAYSLRRRKAVSFDIERQDIDGVLRFGVPLIPHTVGLWAASFLDRFIVAAMAGIAAAGIYTVAFSIALGIGAAHDGVSRFFAPRLAKWTKVGSEAALIRASQFAFGYAALAIITIPVIWVLVAWFVDLVLPSDYDTVLEFMPWLIMAQALIGIARVFTGYLYAAGRTGVQSVVTVVTAAFGLVFALIAVSRSGAIGAAYAAVASGLIRVILTYAAAERTGLLRNPIPARQTDS